MSSNKKLLARILRGTSDTNISFSNICKLLKVFGFKERIKGDHYIYSLEGIEEIINLQPRHSMAKPYQVKQIRNIILHYRLKLEDEKNE